MKIFVATGGCDYEGDTILGVFTSKEKAQAHLETIDRRYFDNRDITEYDTDIGLSYP